MTDLKEIKDRHEKTVRFMDAAGWCASISHQDRATLLQMVDDRDKRIKELEAQLAKGCDCEDGESCFICKDTNND